MDEWERFENALDDKSYSQGGLNFSEFKGMLLEILPTNYKTEITQANNRTELKDIWRQYIDIRPRIKVQEFKVQEAITMFGHPKGFEAPIPVLEALYYSWPEIIDSIYDLNDIVEKLNRLADEMNLEFLWVYDLPSKYRLKMEDVKNVKNGDILDVLMPDEYEEFTEFDKNNFYINSFYDVEGDAVKGSGAYIWIVNRPGLLKEMKKVKKKLESDES